MPYFEPQDDTVEKARKYTEGSPLGMLLFVGGWVLAVGGCTAGTNMGGNHPLVFVLFLLAVVCVVGGRWLMLRGTTENAHAHASERSSSGAQGRVTADQRSPPRPG